MKKYLLIFSFFLCCLSCFAQSISYQNFMKIVTDNHWASSNLGTSKHKAIFSITKAIFFTFTTNKKVLYIAILLHPHTISILAF